jgi:ERCC4-type nuclease
MRLAIDCREPLELINTLEDLINNRTNKTTPIIFDRKALDIGDAIIYFDETDLKNPNKQIIFERKALSDLIASIKDGRYNEQSFRLDQSPVHNHNIYYIVEGNIEKFCKSTRNMYNPGIKQTIYSTMFTISYYKGFSLINSQDIKETANFIFRFLDKLTREKTRVSYYRGVSILDPPIRVNCTQGLDKEDGVGSVDVGHVDVFPSENIGSNSSFQGTIGSSPENIGSNSSSHGDILPLYGGVGGVPHYSDCIKTTKKSNITLDNILEIMLIQIPGVCPAAAQVISAEFKTMKNLIDCLEQNIDCLNEIMIHQNKTRRLSKTAKTNIFKYILQRDQIIEINT